MGTSGLCKGSSRGGFAAVYAKPGPLVMILALRASSITATSARGRPAFSGAWTDGSLVHLGHTSCLPTQPGAVVESPERISLGFRVGQASLFISGS